MNQGTRVDRKDLILKLKEAQTRFGYISEEVIR
jgi:NADH:ubiquinone oxidoreductase subunit E